MTMEECYTQMGANYHRVLRRLGKESLLVKIAEMFPQDESYNRMKAMMDPGIPKEKLRPQRHRLRISGCIRPLRSCIMLPVRANAHAHA